MKTIASCGCEFEKDEDGNIIFNPSIENLRLDCQATWDLIGKGKTKGIFQLESQLGRHFAKSLKPENIEHLSALLAIVRPGVLEAIVDGKSMTQHYIDRKNFKEPIEYFHNAIKPALEATYGVLVYQEQSMQIARDIAGFDLQQADTLRKGIGKKKPEIIAALKDDFINGCIQVGKVTEEEARTIFDWIEKSQRYSFNKCMSGSSRLYRQTGKYGYHPTIEEMYRIRNDIQYAKQTGHISLYKKWKLHNNYGYTLSQYEDGRIRPNIIKNIYFSGLREVWRITLEDGRFIDVTANHKFPTQRGEVAVYQLTSEDQLFVQLPYDMTPTRKYNWSQVTVEDIKNRKIIHDHTTVGFMQGENNPGYVNGEFTKWKNNVALLDDICSDCSNYHRRLEVHHIDGNRENNELYNLTKLCPSCHKKREYAVGRRKKGEKGYPSDLVQIESIVLLGEEEVYDIEMEGPNHNFVTDQGIVSCNSHAVSYAYNAYLTAYCKAHFKHEFYTSSLHFARNKPNHREEIQALIEDAKSNGVMVRKPSLQKRNSYFKLIDKEIYYGLTDIKGIGLSVFDKIQALIQTGENYLSTIFTDDWSFDSWSWMELLLLLLSKINSNAVKSLIGSGALEYIDSNREKLSLEFFIFSKLRDREQKWVHNFVFLHSNRKEVSLRECLQAMILAPTGKGGGIYHKSRVPDIISLEKSCINPGFKVEDSIRSVSNHEETLLGISLSVNNVDRYDISLANSTCYDVLKGNNENLIILVVSIKNFREYICTKGDNKGEPMAFFNVADSTCTLDNVVAFPEAYRQFKDKLYVGNVVALTGKKSKYKDMFVIENVSEVPILSSV